MKYTEKKRGGRCSRWWGPATEQGVETAEDGERFSSAALLTLCFVLFGFDAASVLWLKGAVSASKQARWQGDFCLSSCRRLLLEDSFSTPQGSRKKRQEKALLVAGCRHRFYQQFRLAGCFLVRNVVDVKWAQKIGDFPLVQPVSSLSPHHNRAKIGDGHAPRSSLISPLSSPEAGRFTHETDAQILACRHNLTVL